MILHLLGDRKILDTPGAQVVRSVPVFLAGRSAYAPFFLPKAAEAAMHNLLLVSDSLMDEERLGILKDREKSTGIWDEMHAGGREPLRAGLKSLRHPPRIPRDWLALSERTDYLHDTVLKSVPPDLTATFHGREQEFIRWNPVLRAYREQMLLAIHRHAFVHPTASSKKGPKFQDYRHGAYAAITDVFVTNDKRFACALRQHSELGSVGSYEVMDLEQFLADLRKGRIFEQDNLARR